MKPEWVNEWWACLPMPELGMGTLRNITKHTTYKNTPRPCNKDLGIHEHKDFECQTYEEYLVITTKRVPDDELTALFGTKP